VKRVKFGINALIPALYQSGIRADEKWKDAMNF